MREWQKIRLSDFVLINPTERIAKGACAKKISMEQLQPFSRKVLGFERAKFSGGSKFKNKDTIMARITPCLENGKCAQVSVLEDGEIGFGSTEFIVFRERDGASDSDFVYYLVRSDLIREPAIKSMVGSSGRQRVQTNVLENLEIDLPPLSTQKKIARVLGALDDKIELNNQINHNLEEQARALFKSWFVDFEPFGGTMPDDWKMYRLGDFLPVITGKKNANISGAKGQYPFFSCSQEIAWTDDYSFEGDAILVAGNGDFNVKFYKGKFEAYQRTYVLIPSTPRYASWLYYVVKHNLNLITQSARGSVIKFITKGNLEDFEFSAPKNLANCEIIDVFSSINNTIFKNRQESQRIAELRDTLLPKLMSGEIDVEKVEVQNG